ncbi:MAG: hypothetical protein NZV14_17160 [Bryobacteraceae bacterium]|nr:hypothetical protein [Bryobacteraceae bacterium]MDW8379893.1 hypothetical protein [Bryobacterales bacterium]
MAYLEIPRLQFQAREIHQGRFPLWDPHIWSGQPLIGQTQPGPLYPGNLLFSLLPLREGYLRFSWLNWYWVAIHVFAAWLLYLWICDLGLGQRAALFGGIAFGFGGFVGTVAWLDVVNGIVWAPAVLLFSFRAQRGIRPLGHAALAGVCLGLAWLSGHHELPILLSASTLATWTWFALRDRRLLLPACVCLAIAALVASAQVLPTYEFGRLSRRWIGLEQTVGWKDKIPYRVHTIYSLPARGMLGTVFPQIGRFADASCYVGWAFAGFAFFGAVTCWGERVVRWALVLAAGSLLYSLGSFAPWNGILYAVVPFFDKARIPARGMALYGLALSLLAAYGFRQALAEPASPWLRKLQVFFAVTGGLILAATAAFFLVDKNLDDRLPLGGLACLACCGLIAGWRAQRISRNWWFTGLLLVVLTELTSGGPSFYSSRFEPNPWPYASKLQANHDVAAFLRQQLHASGPFRIAVNDEELGINFGDWHGVDTLQGYVAGVSENILAHELHTPRTQDLLGVRFWLGSKPDRAPGIQEEVFQGQSGIKVFRNPNAFPRAWIAHQTKSVADSSWLRIAIQDPQLDLRTTVVLVGEAPQLERCGSNGQATILSRTPDRILLRTETACRGMLVVSETHYPGWEALLDGQPVRMWEAYGALRGIVVPPGTHEVEMRFRPRSVYAGLGLCAFGLLLATVIWMQRK